MVRLFFSVDVHGSTLVWRKWIKVPELYKVNVLIFAGDLTGKALIPIIMQSDGTWRSTYFGAKWKFKSEGEVKNYEEKLENTGVYFIRVTESEFEALKADQRRVINLIEEKMIERLRSWIMLLVSTIDVKKVKVLVMPGNDDEFIVDPIIKEFEDRGVIYPLDKVLEFEGHEMISESYVNRTPWNTPREMDEEELERYIEKLINKLSEARNAIFNFHCPPYGTRLDLAPKLTKDLKPVFIAGSVVYENVGSKAIRRSMERHQPMLGLHGHIHESHAVDKIGKTICINPGSEYGEGILRGYIIELTKEGVKNYWRVEG